MNDIPRQKLREIIIQFGRGLIDEPRRLEGLLNDLCGEYKREIFVLVNAVKAKVPEDLLVSRGNLPQEVLLVRLTNRLVDKLALSDEAAQWAVESWALALGIIADPGAGLKPKSPYHKTPDFILNRVLTDNPKAHSCAPHLLREGLVLNLESNIDIVFTCIPAGEFLMGSNKKEDPNTDDDELPQHKVFLEECWICKYPVTNLQYSAFVEVTGYRCPDHWPNGLIPPGKEQHPVVYVRWDDACAFCEWVSQVTGEKVRLPSEAEWEKAARGTSGRIWPWGNQLPDKALCNFDENVRGTTPVGEYSPQGDSPYGCADLIGNVWEWTSSLYSSYPYRAEDGREELNVRALRILRGGSFRSNQESARCAYRYGDYPGLTLDIGFRVALLPSKTLIENIK